MADNTDKYFLDNPTNIQSDIRSEDIIPTNETETINPNQKLKNTEVHHHSHAHGNKNWKLLYY